MNRLSKPLLSVLCLCWLALPAHAATGVGPYYAMPSWDQTLPAETRFVVLTNMKSEAVLDRETGLVWEKEPSREPASWYGARSHCMDSNTGGRMGWRLPAIPELMSLVDRVPLPSLPPGHPFAARPLGYWSTTTMAEDAGAAWFVHFNGGVVSPEGKFTFLLVWCVRGGSSSDTQ